MLKEQLCNCRKSIDIVLKCYDKLHINTNKNAPEEHIESSLC
jgi:hypothetical protein